MDGLHIYIYIQSQVNSRKYWDDVINKEMKIIENYFNLELGDWADKDFHRIFKNRSKQ